jgi:hypothetical protein
LKFQTNSNKRVTANLKNDINNLNSGKMERREFLKKGMAAAAVTFMSQNLLANYVLTSSYNKFNDVYINENFYQIGDKNYRFNLHLNKNELVNFNNSKNVFVVLDFVENDKAKFFFVEVVYKIVSMANIPNGRKIEFKGVFQKMLLKKTVGTEEVFSIDKIPNYFQKQILFAMALPLQQDTIELYISDKKYISLNKERKSDDFIEECFLTTACVKSKQLPDDCEELQTLRSFRDKHLKSSEEGKRLIAHYYEIAPGIVEKINALDNSKVIYDFMYNTLVLNTIELIDSGNNQAAIQYYKEYTESLETLFS